MGCAESLFMMHCCGTLFFADKLDSSQGLLLDLFWSVPFLEEFADGLQAFISNRLCWGKQSGEGLFLPWGQFLWFITGTFFQGNPVLFQRIHGNSEGIPVDAL